ncbi:hypothetical protein SEA_TWONLO_69 [Gordonia phage Twonlo]|uniref:Uncharacterized protein n=1 Tax=Gordonia phage GTE6 TaxID=1647474 RepID=A0A0K0MX02_9CAUD|nr:hypothetical protein AU100_gp72 [Gordonia phage GTE6]AKI28714.1 hypothetical protein GTE6_72 [Gordonia phage GTE6]QOI66815.1 hypothetical protein SEA_TWONLO_69 [Gordonia phage Twonlo]
MSYYYPPTVTGPLDRYDYWDREVRAGRMFECDQCGEYGSSSDEYEHQRSDCPAEHGAAAYRREAIYNEHAEPPTTATDRFRTDWLNARRRALTEGQNQ